MILAHKEIKVINLGPKNCCKAFLVRLNLFAILKAIPHDWWDQYVYDRLELLKFFDAPVLGDKVDLTS